MTGEDREQYLAHARLPVVQRRIAEAMEDLDSWRQRCRKPYVAWSTGKDSTVALWLARQVDPDIEAVYFDADASLPETEQMLRDVPDLWGGPFRVVKTRPLLEVLAHYGLDHPRIEYQTMRATVYEPVQQLRTEGYDGVVVGIRAEESRGRRMGVARYGRIFDSRASGMLTAWPLARWTSMDVWAIIAAHDIPYNRAYDLPWDRPREELRVSYWAGETFRTYGRYAWLKHHHPELFRRLVEAVPEAARYA